MRRLLLLLLLLLLCGIAVSMTAVAAEPDEPDEPVPPRITELVETLEAEESGFAPTLIDPAQLDEAGRDAQRRALQAYYDYRHDGYEHRRRVFAWQLLSSKIIFGLVILLVLSGIYFSWLQFRQGLRDEKGGDTRTTLEASPGGIKLSSPVLGVIILTLSLLFFYLYLVYVYPIEEIL